MKKFMQGNVVAADAAVANGLVFYAGYPITPSTETLERLAEKMDSRRFINAFSELEAINLLYGAGAAGKRCMTATSGCGLSLMREGLSYMVGAKVPAVIYNVMRFGPGLGGITTSNQDLSLCFGVGHGQSKVPIFTPSTVQEIADCMMYAFDLADALRIPVLVMVDATLGQMYETVEIHKSEYSINKDWAVGQSELPPDKSGGILCPSTPHYKNHVITSRKVIQSYKTLNDEQEEQIKFILEREKEMIHICKYICKEYMPQTVKFTENKNGKYIVATGTTARVIQEVAEKIGLGYIVPLLINPFEFNLQVKELTVVEVGGQQLYDIMKYHFPNAKINSVVFSHIVPDAEEIMEMM